MDSNTANRPSDPIHTRSRVSLEIGQWSCMRLEQLISSNPSYISCSQLGRLNGLIAVTWNKLEPLISGLVI